MALVEITPPESEPLSLEEAKLHLRVDGTEEDSLITSLIGTAREAVETITRRALITQGWKLKLDCWPGAVLPLPLPPLQTVQSIQYTNDLGETKTVDPENYLVEADGEPGRIALVSGGSWPTETLPVIGGISVNFTAGYGDTGEAVPQAIRQAMLLLIAHYYENREAVVNSSGANIQLLPMGVSALLQTYRFWSF